MAPTIVHGRAIHFWPSDRVRFAQIVVAAFGLAHAVCEVGQVDDALRIDLRVVVEEHDDVGTRARLNRRGDTRLQVVAVHGLEIDLDSQRFLGSRQQLLAQQLIGSRHEVVPAQPVYRRALCKSGRAAGGQDAGHAAHECGTALEDVTSRYSRHAFLPGDVFGRSDAGLDSLSVDRASVVQRMRAFSRAQHVVSTVICWCCSGFQRRWQFRRETA